MNGAFKWAAGVLVAGLLAGCEWQSADSDTQAWNDAYNWVNFNGIYRGLSGGGLVVTEYGRTPGSVSSSEVVRDEVIATSVGAGTFYSGSLANFPVAPGTLNIVAGGIVYTDNGTGGLTASGTRVGSITYSTGFWSIDLLVDVPAGQSIVGSYSYTTKGTQGAALPGNTGDPIYAFTVIQEGNLLTFIDSSGNTYSGRMGSASSTSGDILNTRDGVIVAQFEVRGTVGGQEVRIAGIFQGSLATANPNVLFDRQIQATWIESGGRTGDIMAGAPSIVVYLPSTGTDARPAPATTNTTVYTQ